MDYAQVEETSRRDEPKQEEFCSSQGLDSQGLHRLALHSVIMISTTQLIHETLGHRTQFTYPGPGPFMHYDLMSRGVCLFFGLAAGVILFWITPRIAKRFSKYYDDDFEKSSDILLMTVLCRAGGLYLLLRFFTSVVTFLALLCYIIAIGLYEGNFDTSMIFSRQTMNSLLPLFAAYTLLFFVACMLFGLAEKVAWLLCRLSPTQIPAGTNQVILQNRLVIFRGLCFLFGLGLTVRGIFTLITNVTDDKNLIQAIIYIAFGVLLFIGPKRLYHAFIELRKTPVKPE